MAEVQHVATGTTRKGFLDASQIPVAGWHGWIIARLLHAQEGQEQVLVMKEGGKLRFQPNRLFPSGRRSAELPRASVPGLALLRRSGMKLIVLIEQRSLR